MATGGFGPHPRSARAEFARSPSAVRISPASPGFLPQSKNVVCVFVPYDGLASHPSRTAALCPVIPGVNFRPACHSG